MARFRAMPAMRGNISPLPTLLQTTKKPGVTDVCFLKRKGLDIFQMVKSKWVYRKLRDFRAGIEARIPTLKRSFGLSQCTCTGRV